MILRPPRLAEWLVRRSTPDAERAAQLGDLEEEFRDRLATDGRGARRWYWRQTVRSVPSNLRRRLFPEPTLDGKDRAMTSIGQDLRFALRMLRRRPLVTGVAVLSLTVGIAMSVGVFALLDAAVLRPLPLRDPGELRVLLEQRERGTNHNFSYPGFVAYRAVQRSFTDLVAFSATTSALEEPGGSSVIAGELVSGHYFSELGPRIAIGRGLTDADMAPGAAEVVVLARAEWRRLFGDPAELGARSVRLNGRDFAVVGVAADPFRGMQVGGDARFWAPVAAQPVLDPFGGQSFLTMPTVSWLTVMGRLRPGVDDAAAMAELNATGAGLTQVREDGPAPRFFLIPGHQGDSGLAAQVEEPLELLLGASLLVLLVACANVAGLLLARAGDRTREIAVRTALGAGRWRITRLLLLESIVLGVAGTAGGLMAARWVAPIGAASITQFGQPVTLDVRLSGRVMAFATAAGLLTALVAGLAPVLRGWRHQMHNRLHDGGRTATAGRGAIRWQRSLVAGQFALTLALVVTAGLLVRTLLNLQSIPTGLAVDQVALVGVNPQAVQYDLARTRDYLVRLTERVASLPGVRAAGFGRVIPLGFGGARMTVEVPGYSPAADGDMELNYNVVSPGYFEALGIDILDGRALAPSDTGNGPMAVVVSETMARRYWPDGRAVGRTLKLPGDGPTLDVVGVARDVKYRTIREDSNPSFYLSVLQAAVPRGGIIHVRTHGEPDAHLDTLRQAVADVDPAVPITLLSTLREQVRSNVARERLTMAIGLVLGGTALLLAAVGLFGAMATLVGRRARELGVRLALGAVPSQLASLVLREGLRMAIWGGALGFALAIWVGQLVESRLYGVGAFDPVSAAVGLALVAGVALVAAWLPARRAARVDPVGVLRAE